MSRKLGAIQSRILSEPKKKQPLCPNGAYIRELRRPWKLLSFSAGMSWLIYGALSYGIGDWDVGISLLMGTSTYLFAPWSVYLLRSVILNRPSNWITCLAISALLGILVTDTSYWTYHAIVGNTIDRKGNFYASICLYYLAGAIWQYSGSAKEFLVELRSSLNSK